MHCIVSQSCSCAWPSVLRIWNCFNKRIAWPCFATRFPNKFVYLSAKCTHVTKTRMRPSNLCLPFHQKLGSRYCRHRSSEIESWLSSHSKKSRWAAMLWLQLTARSSRNHWWASLPCEIVCTTRNCFLEPRASSNHASIGMTHRVKMRMNWMQNVSLSKCALHPCAEAMQLAASG